MCSFIGGISKQQHFFIRLLLRDQLVFFKKGNQLNFVTDSKLVENIGKVVFHGSFGNFQRVGDVLVGRSLINLPDDLDFPGA